MTKVRPRCLIQGVGFSPSKIKGVAFEDAHEPNAIGTLGRYKGRPIPYGAATICTAELSGGWELLDMLISLLETHIATIRDAGAEEITLHCDVVHDGQCNFDLEREQLLRIYNLDVAFTISCWSDIVE